MSRLSGANKRTIFLLFLLAGGFYVAGFATFILRAVGG